jgi:hypothetical protein
MADGINEVGKGHRIQYNELIFSVSQFVEQLVVGEETSAVFIPLFEQFLVNIDCFQILPNRGFRQSDLHHFLAGFP